MHLNVVTYNVRGCRGLDGKTCHRRIADILRDCDADVIALQELDAGRARSQFIHQPDEIAQHLGMKSVFYCCDGWHDGQYGTAILSRHPIQLVRSANLPRMAMREPRGAVWAAINWNGQRINVVNTHLGLHPRERAAQVSALLGADWLGHDDLAAPAILCGDFNLTRSDPLYRTLTNQLCDVHTRMRRRHAPTWLGLRTLDFILVNRHVNVHDVRTHRPFRAFVASDHVPVVAKVALEAPQKSGDVA